MRTIYQRGQVFPLFAIMLVVLVGISALSVDVGYYRYQQRLQQAAADSAAIAGAQASFYDSTNSLNYQNAAYADAQQNGFTNGSNGVVVNVVPNYTDAGNCSGGCVQVTISKPYPVFFGSIFSLFANGSDQRQIASSAAAKLQAGGGACLTSLGQITVQTTKNGNGGGITGPDCGIADADCTNVNGNGSKLDVASWTENEAAGACNSCAIQTGSCTVGLPPVDPCSVTAQCQTLANASAASLGLTSLTTPSCSSPPTTTTSPFSGGCYNNQTFSGTMNPGLYVITGTATFGTVTGTGVTLYLAKGASLSTGNGNGNGSVTLTAPTIGSGNYNAFTAGEEGIALYQAYDSTNPWALTLHLDITFTGLSYLPNMSLTQNGHAITVTGDLAAAQYTLNGNGNGGITLNPGNNTTTALPEIPLLAE